MHQRLKYFCCTPTLVKNFFLLAVHFIFIQEACAQIPSKLWLFGSRGGIDFRKSTAEAYSSPAFFNAESNTTITDSAGNLLFYVAHDRVYNKTHSIMKNGDNLIGNGGSSAQAPLVVQNPSDANQFYVFQTADETVPVYRGNLRYSIVNLCGDDGKGEVIASQKNIPIPGNFSERITAVPLQNGKAFWILVSGLFTNTLFAYYLDDSGINPLPVNSSFGNQFSAQVGFIVVNHKRTQLLYSSGLNTMNNGVWLMDFDTLSGMASNRIEISRNQHDYGIAFSPNDKMIYYSYFYVRSGVVQYEISTARKQTLVDRSGNYHYGSLKEGPDGKIYVARVYQNAVDFIEFPDHVGLACAYRNNAFQLAPQAICYLSLQNGEYYFKDKKKVWVRDFILGNDTTICDFSHVELKVNYPFPVWSDGSRLSQLHVEKEGKYWVTYENCDSLFTDTIVIHKGLYRKVDTVYICAGDSVWVNGRWYSQSGALEFSRPGQAGCDSLFAIWIVQHPKPGLLIEEIKICPGDSVAVHGKWYNDSIDLNMVLPDSNGCKREVVYKIRQHEAPVVGREEWYVCRGDSVYIRGLWYYDSVSLTFRYKNYRFCDSLHVIRLHIIEPPELQEYQRFICKGDSLYIHDQWIKQPQVYHYRKTNSGQCDSLIAYRIDYFEPVQWELPDEVLIPPCEQRSVSFQSNAALASWRWFPPEGLSCTDCREPAITEPFHAVYFLELKDLNGCTYLDSVSVKRDDAQAGIHLPNVFSPNGDQVNDVFPGDLLHGDFVVKIFDRWGELVFEGKNRHWDGTFKALPMPPDTYMYLIETGGCFAKQKLKGGVSLMR